MYGRTTGTLSLTMYPTSQQPRVLFTKSGSQENRWIPANVTLSSSVKFQVIGSTIIIITPSSTLSSHQYNHQQQRHIIFIVGIWSYYCWSNVFRYSHNDVFIDDGDCRKLYKPKIKCFWKYWDRTTYKTITLVLFWPLYNTSMLARVKHALNESSSLIWKIGLEQATRCLWWAGFEANWRPSWRNHPKLGVCKQIILRGFRNRFRMQPTCFLRQF